MKTRFLRDVKKHKMTILKDDGVYRHLRFQQPKTTNQYFDIVTYPNYLVISGDMGDYVFSRLYDMFNFFSTTDNKLNINIGYWTEKLKAVSKFGGKDGEVFEFSAEHTLKELKYSGSIKNIPVKQRKEFSSAILNCSDEGDAINVMEEYNIYDSWEYLGTIPTPYIEWILYAIKWGILKYEKDVARRLKQSEKSKRKPGFLNENS